MSDPVDYNGGAARLRLHRRRSIGYKFERSKADAATWLHAFISRSAVAVRCDGRAPLFNPSDGRSIL